MKSATGTISFAIMGASALRVPLGRARVGRGESGEFPSRVLGTHAALQVLRSLGVKSPHIFTWGLGGGVKSPHIFLGRALREVAIEVGASKGVP